MVSCPSYLAAAIVFYVFNTCHVCLDVYNVLYFSVVNDDARAMQMQMGMGAGPGMAFDAPKAYKQERVNLRLHVHEYALEYAEKKLLGDVIPKKIVNPAAMPGASPGDTARRSKMQKRR